MSTPVLRQHNAEAQAEIKRRLKKQIAELEKANEILPVSERISPPSTAAPHRDDPLQ
jgi:hypothetical protein